MNEAQFLSYLYEAAKAAGFFGTLLVGFFLWDERRQHAKTREKLDADREEGKALVRELVGAMKDAAVSIQRASEIGESTNESIVEIARSIAVLNDRNGRSGGGRG